MNKNKTEYDAIAALLDVDMGAPSEWDTQAPAPKRTIDDILIDTHRNAPKPSADCLYGLVGEIARAGSDNTEANPFAVAASALAYLGTAVGRGPVMHIGDDWHHARLFMVHVGRSSRGRKGTAKKLVISRIAKAVKEINEHLAPHIHTGGLSTREGLALMIHDGFTEGKNEVPAINDKRLLAVEAEFANVLHQSKREGNTLSAALREVWDGGGIKPATKTNRVWVKRPHIGLLADITPSELLSLMASRELTNGFANRFIFFWAEGDKVNPAPKPTPSDVVAALAEAVAGVLRFAGADRHAEGDLFRMELSKDAFSAYAKLYRGELRDRSAGEQVTGLLDRRAPMLMRLAMIFALTDKTLTIGVPHINAGMAWIRYWADSVKFIFQNAMDEAAVAEINDTAKQVLAYLVKVGKASRTEITKGCFGGHSSSDKINKALDELLSAAPALIEVETVPRPKGQHGSPTKFYKPYANSANSANYEHPCGLQPDSGVCEISEVSEFSYDHNTQDSQDSQKAKPLETRMPIDNPHNSHNSQPNPEKQNPRKESESF